MDKLKYIKLKNEDGTYTNAIPLAVDADHVDVGGDTLTSKLNTLATKTEVAAVASGAPKPVSSISQMTDTTKVYVLTTDGNWYYYNGSAWVSGGVYLADNTLNEKINDLMLNKVYDNEVDMNDLKLTIGSISITTGQFLDRTNRVRTTGFLYSYIFNLVKSTNNNYKIDALYYDASGTYLNSYSDWQNDYVVIPKDVPRFHLVISKIDDSDVTEDDITTIKSSLKFYKPYDNLLESEQNKLVNNIVISNNIQNAQKRQYNIERLDYTLSTSSFSSVSVNKYNGNRGSTNDPYRVSTGRASYDTNGIRIVYNNPNYKLTVFYYTKSEGSQNGFWYQGFVEYGTQADFIPLYRNYTLQFERVDGEQIYGVEMLQEIVDSVKQYIATKNKIFSGYKRFEIENEVNGVTQKIKAILSLPSSYTEGGKPCKIIAMLHGGSGAITDSNWYGTDWNNMATLLKNNGYAVFDVNRLNESETNFGRTYGGRLAIENIHLAFKWIKEHYNVEDKMYIHGTSMGGATALSYILNYSNEVVACSCFAPVSNLSSIHLQADQEMLAQCFGYSTQAEAIADGYKKIVGYSPALKFDRHNNTTNEFIPYNLETILPTIQNDYVNRFWNKNDEFLRINLNMPIKIWIGSSDTVIDLPFCRKYIEALRNTGSNAELVELSGQDHHNISFALPDGMKDEWIEFLNRF